MKDFQAVALLEVAPVKSAQLVSLNPLVFLFRGGDYSKVSKVLFDGVESPHFQLRGSSALLAEVPVSKTGNLFRTVSVITTEFTGAPTSVILYEAQPWLVDGLFKLLQQFVTLLLTTPGTDRFHPEWGGGLKLLIGANTGTSDIPYVLGHISTAVERCAEAMVQSQSTHKLDDAERLAGVEILDIRYHRPTLGFKLLLELRAASQLGLQFGLGVE